MKALKNIIDKYSNSDFIDIENIIYNYWIEIDYIDFEKINWIIIWDRIWISKNISKEKQRFTLAHEFCHFLLKEKWASTWPFASIEFREKRADTFAMNLLLPDKALIEAYNNYQNLPTLANMFWVPEKVVEKRLNNLFYNKKLYVRS